MTKQELADRLKVASYHVDDYAWNVSSDAVLQLVNEIEQSHKHSVMQGLPTDNEIERWVKEHGYYGHCTQEYHEGLDEGARWVISKLSGSPTVCRAGGQ